MADAMILSGLNHITDLDAASDFEKKHTPYVTTEKLESGATKVSAKVGHYVAHPNESDHFIEWIEYQVDSATIARFNLSPVAVNPEVSAVVALDPGTTIRVVEFCNLHGLWATDIAV